jgi:hypothetical protein
MRTDIPGSSSDVDPASSVGMSARRAGALNGVDGVRAAGAGASPSSGRSRSGRVTRRSSGNDKEEIEVQHSEVDGGWYNGPVEEGDADADADGDADADPKVR